MIDIGQGWCRIFCVLSCLRLRAFKFERKTSSVGAAKHNDEASVHSLGKSRPRIYYSLAAATALMNIECWVNHLARLLELSWTQRAINCQEAKGDAQFARKTLRCNDRKEVKYLLKLHYTRSIRVTSISIKSRDRRPLTAAFVVEPGNLLVQETFE